MSAVALRSWLETHAPDSVLAGLADQLVAMVPAPATLEDDQWNIIGWKMRPGNSRFLYLYFDKISNADLRVACKIWILHSRKSARIAHGSAATRVVAVSFLDQCLAARPLGKLNTADFLKAENILKDSRSQASAYGVSKELQAFASWLNVRTGLRLSYISGIKKPKTHGRHSSDAARESKMLPDEVLRDLVAANQRSDLSDYDRFFLQVFVLNVGAGFRVGELAYLPADCLLENNGALQVVYFPEKGGAPVPKVVPPSLVPAVRAAVESLQASTAELRRVAAAVQAAQPWDWRGISDDEEAAKYFVAKFAHEWTADPANRIASPDGAWHRWKREYIDVVGVMNECGGNQSEATRRLGISRSSLMRMLGEQQGAKDGRFEALADSGAKRKTFVGDHRAINERRLKAHTRSTVYERYASVRLIVADAQAHQLRGETYPQPVHSAELEKHHRRSFALVRDVTGKTLLEAQDALLLKQRPGAADDFLAVTAGDLAVWLYKKDVGSVFERLGIIDPRTGEIAKFTWHDVRHWLDTQFERGGLTQQQIALIFGRKDVRQNAVYDQTTGVERTERLRQAVRDGQLTGVISETYSRLADTSREQAEEFLAAAMRMVNIMPHGLCTLNWAMSPCPHFLSCFTCGGEEGDQGPCEHLVVDRDSESQINEVQRLRTEAQAALKVIPPESPMFDRYLRVFTNTSLKLEQLRVRLTK